MITIGIDRFVSNRTIGAAAAVSIRDGNPFVVTAAEGSRYGECNDPCPRDGTALKSLIRKRSRKHEAKDPYEGLRGKLAIGFTDATFGTYDEMARWVNQAPDGDYLLAFGTDLYA